MGWFLETVAAEYNRMRARAFSDGYEGVEVAGLAVVAADTGRVLLAQRAMDETDDPEVQETWEFPGGHLNPDEDPFTAAMREFSEEVGANLPEDVEVVHGWRAGEADQYQGFVIITASEADVYVEGFEPNDEVQAIGWFDRGMIDMLENLRPEMSTVDWTLIFGVSGNEESTMDETDEMTEPDLTLSDIAVDGIPIHGVLAPEDTETGDGRGFNAGSMTSRPGRLPFSWQIEYNPGHDKSVVTGSVDRLMRKDGLIHWEGRLMPSATAGDFTELLVFFHRYGVSVDGDMGRLDTAKTEQSGVMWFDAVRASGLTAVAIPAFHEAYVALGPHPEMPHPEDGSLGHEAALTAALTAAGDLVTFDRGPGWVTNPEETRRIHAYWTKKGQPGYAKIGWGTPGDFTRAKKLIGAKIAANSPEDMRYLNQIIAQWHFDALGYWPGDWDKPGNDTTAEGRAKRAARAASHGIELGEGTEWEAVLVSSVSADRNVHPPLSYFHRQESTEALVIEEPDEDGFIRTYGYAAEWGVCHIGMDQRCVEPPRTYSDDYPEFHLGRTKTDEGYINTGVLTYGVGHRDADTILAESPDQAFFDNINNAWAAVRVGEDERGIWFAGVVLPDVPESHLVKIEASGQVSGEWKYGAMRACLTVNVPGYPVQRASAVYDEEGNVMALAASAFGNIEDAPCVPTPAERMAALKAAHEEAEAEARFAALKAEWVSGNPEGGA